VTEPEYCKKGRDEKPKETSFFFKKLSEEIEKCNIICRSLKD
jgi:hypothetical protein